MANDPILVLGANGQVGHELQRTMIVHGRVVALDVPDIDFSQPESLRETVQKLRPAVIVNAAAYTAVDKAEANAELALAINAAAPRVLAEEAEALGAVLVHYSTDYVFDGRKASPYVEADTCNPLSVYGRTKREGEKAAATCRRHLTFRTSWVVGIHGANFIKTMLRLAGERDTLRVIADQIGAPTTAALLAEVTAAVIGQMSSRLVDDAHWGLYHLTASGSTSWNGLARHVIARAVERGLPLKARPETVEPITTADYPTPAARPANSRLDTSKLRNTFALTLPQWQDGVDAVVDGIVPMVRT